MRGISDERYKIKNGTKLDVLSLARMVGHKDLRQLQIYFNLSAEDMAKKL